MHCDRMLNEPSNREQHTNRIQRQTHTHPADHTDVVTKQIMNQVSKRCTDEVKLIPSLFTEELNELRDNEWDNTTREAVGRLLTFTAAKSKLYRDR